MKLTKCYVINIKTNRNKYFHFYNQAKQINLNYSFFEAITPKFISKTKFLYKTNEAIFNFGRPLMQTEIACALSHISLWQKLLDDNKYDFYLIFEDDVYFNKELNFFVNNQDLNSYDLIRLCGNKIRYNKKIKNISEDSSLVQFSYGCLTGAAYRISKKAARKLLDYCNNLKYPIDILLDRSFDHGVKNYGILPFPVETDWHNNDQDPLFTDIGIRKSKLNNISLKIKIIRKFNRIKTSYFRRISALKLFFKYLT